MHTFVGHEDKNEKFRSARVVTWGVDECLRDKVSLELVQVNVEGAVEAQRRRDRGDNLGDQAVKVDEAGLRNVELVLADIEDRLVVNLVSHHGVISPRQISSLKHSSVP